MSNFDRRQFLKSILGKLVQTAGTVVVASAAAARTQGDESPETATPPEDVRGRADRLAANGNVPDAADASQLPRPGGFRNTPLGSFHNAPLGGFRNTPLGAFRNSPVGGFRNTPLGAFGNTGWPNGGWPNGGWGGFQNGGWPNVGWRNW
jgi:hypothetical protein